MSDNTEKNSEFYKIADEFIAVANEHGTKTDQGQVSATFLYGAARFNTYLVASASGSSEELNSRKDQAIKYFMGEYEKMLEEHFADYINNYDTYMGSPQTKS